MKQNNLYTWINGKLYPFIQFDIDIEGTYGLNICAVRRSPHRTGVWVPALLEEENTTTPVILNEYPWTFVDGYSEVAANVNIFKMLETGYILFVAPPSSAVGGNEDLLNLYSGAAEGIDTPVLVPHICDSVAYYSALENPDTVLYPNTDIKIKELSLVRLFVENVGDQPSYNVNSGDIIIITQHETSENIIMYNQSTLGQRRTETLLGMTPGSSFSVSIIDDNLRIVPVIITCSMDGVITQSY